MREIIVLLGVLSAVTTLADAASFSPNARAVDNALYRRFLCSKKPDGFKAIVPGSCSRYFQCHNGESVEIACPAYYDATKNACVDRNPGCIEDRQIVAAVGPVSPYAPCAGKERGYVVGQNQAYWYECFNGAVVASGVCPQGQEYNLALLRCDVKSVCGGVNEPPCAEITTPCAPIVTTTTCAPVVTTPCTTGTTTTCARSTETITAPTTVQGTTNTGSGTTSTTSTTTASTITTGIVTGTTTTTTATTTFKGSTGFFTEGTSPATAPTTTTTTTSTTPTTTTCTTRPTTPCTTRTTTTCTTSTTTMQGTTSTYIPITISTGSAPFITTPTPFTTTKKTTETAISPLTGTTPLTTTTTCLTTTPCITTTTTCVPPNTTPCTQPTPTTPVCITVIVQCTTQPPPICVSPNYLQPQAPNNYARPAVGSPSIIGVLPPQTHESNVDLYIRYACRDKINGFMLASLRSCNEYYICRNGDAVKVSCGDKYFNSLKGQCDLPQNTGCIQPYQNF
ncbi:mucin-2 [Eurosta solidaginis]|uniref:mucin-2 n=1 Tax=Eurosta solidaginis TaxID=178769 RepID=UPI0035314513